jgi:hypothetical protein
MNLLPADHQHAARYQAAHLQEFPSLTGAQLEQIRSHSRQWLAWSRTRPALHNAINVALLLGLFCAEAGALLVLPRLLPLDLTHPASAMLAALLCGALHGMAVCSLVTFSVHEGAAHNLIIQGQGRGARWLRAFAHNACRLFFADPEYYAKGHVAHHRDFGTLEDGAFTNFVRVRRLLFALLPMAPVFRASDFFPWRPQESTRSLRLTHLLSNLHLGALAIASYLQFGFLFTAVGLFVVGTWVSYAIDRVRESTEHLFMPMDPENGTREFGLGFWGLLLGAGPWGQPCHMSHHLAPALPWYQQLRMHFLLRRLLTEEQKRHFFLRPVVGFPSLLWRLVTETGARPAQP